MQMQKIIFIFFRHHHIYSLFGLALGLACVFIISAWTLQELQFDRFHHQPKRIYMVTTDVKDNTGNFSIFPETPQPLATELSRQIPQIEKAFHFLYLYGGRNIESAGQSYMEFGIAADSDFLEVLNFKLLSGSIRELDQLNTIFLSQDFAKKLFPGSDPINQELIYQEDQVLEVKGVFKNCPMNSSLQFDFLISYETEFPGTTGWHQLSDATFIRLKSSADPDLVLPLMKKIWRENLPYEEYDLGMISIADLRYGADFEFFNAEHGHGDRNKLYLFIGVAALILILACLNYLILSSANAMKREKEIWIRKVHGASPGAISSTFIYESVLLSIMAWVIAALISILGIRAFEHLIGIVISPTYFYTCIFIGLFLSILIVGVSTGFYPAVQAGTQVLVSSEGGGRTGIRLQRHLRQTFVGSQFMLSIALTISGLVVFRQAGFMKHFDSGYATGNIVEFSLPAKSDSIQGVVKDWIKERPEVTSFSFANQSPVHLTVLNTRQDYRWEGLEGTAHTSIFQIYTDEQYIQVFEIPLMKGRFFLPSDDGMGRIVINETLAAMMGQADPLGQVIRRGDQAYEVIGVVRDFNFQHLSNEIRPLLMMYRSPARNLYVRFRPEGDQVVEMIQEKKSSMSGSPVRFSYISDMRDNLYTGESQILAAIMFFTVLCIMLSGLGLVGLVSHNAAERRREIAIRKVYGATSGNLMISQHLRMFSMFLPGAFFGSILAWGIMSRWMENYAYRNGIEAWVFVAGPGIILGFAMLSISYQTWKASRQSPAISLEYH